MKKTKIKIIMMLAILIASFGTMQAKAQGKCEYREKAGMHYGMGKGDKNIAFINDLTPEQEKQIDALKTNLIKESITTKNLIAEKQAHLKTISTGDNVDMAAVNKTIDELFVLKADMHKKHEVFRQDVRKLLTADQKVIFDVHSGKGQGSGGNYHGNSGCKGDRMGSCKGMSSGVYGGCMHKGYGSEDCQGKGNAGCCKGHNDGGCCKNGDGQKAGCQGYGQGQGSGCGHGKGCKK